MTTHSHRSVAVITYRIADHVNGNPDTIMQEFLGGLDKLDKDGHLIRDMIPADSVKYFDFISNHSKKATGFYPFIRLIRITSYIIKRAYRAIITIYTICLLAMIKQLMLYRIGQWI